ncbi:hypothetical protein QBC47DRAFT_53940 [Echria macrotheca]|uniref:Peptidase A1 domain-containing protein n=1 Tax=Echria macrotheca TaxID=438768 RepID=A0AAJ0BAK5_9PEZI|nr:hypothetical protein QBC47DRAFT_53940 [Echria macrotheca]
MVSKSLLFGLAFGIAHTAVAQSCQTPPSLALNLGPCRLLSPDKSDVNSWGITVEVQGTELCVMPSTTVNSTFLTENSICNDDQLDMSSVGNINMTTKQCRSRRGGFVDRTTVASANVDDVKAANPGWSAFNNLTAAATVTLQFLDDKVTDVIGWITEGQKSTTSHLGLASQSTFLSRLKAAGLITTLSWGLNSGSQSFQFPRPGSLVIGAYDKGSLAGPFFDYSVASKPLEGRFCPLQVVVTGLVITSRNNTKELVNKANKWDACIEPYDNLFRMPGNALDQFREFLHQNTKLTGDTVLPATYKDTLLNLEPGIVYPKDAGDLNATMRFTINYNQTVEIPFYELQRPLRGLDVNGSVITDQDYNELQIYDSPAEGDAPVLGKVFLSQLYLYVNYEQMTFHLASQKAEATTPLLESPDCASTPSRMAPETIGLIVVGSVLGLLIIVLIVAAARRWVTKRRGKPEPSDKVLKPGTPPRTPDVPARSLRTVPSLAETSKVSHHADENTLTRGTETISAYEGDHIDPLDSSHVNLPATTGKFMPSV